MYHKLIASVLGAAVALAFAATATLAATDGGRALFPAGSPAFGLDVTGTVPVTPTPVITVTPPVTPTPTITGTGPVSPTPTVTGTTGFSGTLNPGQAMIAGALAIRFGVSISDVMSIRDQKQGWGEVFKILLLSELTGKTPAEIMAMRQEDKGWGQIFHALNVMPKKKDNLGQAIKGGKATATPTPTSPVVAPSSRKPAAATPVPTRPPKSGSGNSGTHGNSQGRGNAYGPDNNPGGGKGR